MGMKATLIVCVALTWVAQVSAHTWEFGQDVSGSKVIAHESGKISLFEKDKDVYFTVPPCDQLAHVLVTIDNVITTPAVTFNKNVTVVHISCKILQFSASKYEVIAKAIPDHYCYSTGQSNRPKGTVTPK